ncbi:hypothetical protein [Mycobacterium servetii]|uniref:Uncharacterized protein n=1 Tax=Mycobacterium servetii TaxID=3237418 RepID=A0ABV4C2Z9_9MYCO
MFPSTKDTGPENAFAAVVLHNLLGYIEEQNAKGFKPFHVSHAWTQGPMMYLVYSAPPSDITRGLVRDTRRSLIDRGHWPSQDEAVLYYYLLDLEERQPWGSRRKTGEPDTILWDGYPLNDDLPQRPADIASVHRYTRPAQVASVQRDKSQDRRVVNEPRRYADPF